MKTKILFFPLFVAIFVLSAVPSFAASSQNGLTEVKPEKVCMINNQLFEKDQIPVQVEGKTYYGCCQMCEKRLKNDPSSRMAVDPVSGKQVDKASSVIAAAPDGSIFYFESKESMSKFSAQ